MEVNKCNALKLIIGLIGDEIQNERDSEPNKKFPRKKRAVWSRYWLLRRSEGRDVSHIVLRELQYEDEELFRNFNRMTSKTFHKLLELVGPDITKQDTILREAIPAQTRLLITLRFLATGETYSSLSVAFRISQPAISKIVPEVINAIVKLKSDYIRMPQNKQDWLNIAKNFEEMWNFPLCIGALDGKHVAFRARRDQGSFFYNYKGFHSIVLLALVDAKYNFLYVDIGCNGRANDAAVYNNSSLCQAIDSNLLEFPNNTFLPGIEDEMPYVIVTDDAFKLTTRTMKPHRQRTCDANKIFNYRLSRARRVVENAFGILTNKFRVLMTTIDLSVEKVEKITFATCVLHNFIKIEERQILDGLVDAENVHRVEVTNSEWRRNSGMLVGLQSVRNRAASEPIRVRENFTAYFNGQGAVPWQQEAIDKFNF